MSRGASRTPTLPPSAPRGATGRNCYRWVSAGQRGPRVKLLTRTAHGCPPGSAARRPRPTRNGLRFSSVTTCVARRRAFLGAALAACLVGTAGCGQYGAGRGSHHARPAAHRRRASAGHHHLADGHRHGRRRQEGAGRDHRGRRHRPRDRRQRRRRLRRWRHRPRQHRRDRWPARGGPADAAHQPAGGRRAARALPGAPDRHRRRPARLQRTGLRRGHLRCHRPNGEQPVRAVGHEGRGPDQRARRGTTKSAPLIGVSPTGFLRVAASNATVPVTLARLTPR